MSRDVELQSCTRFEWERIVRRCMIPFAAKAVGFVLAQYGDAAGRQIRPGTPRLMAVGAMGERTVERHIATLRKLGLITKVRNGGGPNREAAEWRLTVPTDLPGRVEMLTPDEESPATQVAAVPDLQPVDNEESPATQMAAVPGPSGAELPPLVTELPPSDDRTPATQVADHQETTQGTPKTSPEVSTSPVDPQVTRSRDPTGPEPVPPPPGWRKRRPVPATEAS